MSQPVEPQDPEQTDGLDAKEDVLGNASCLCHVTLLRDFGFVTSKIQPKQSVHSGQAQL